MGYGWGIYGLITCRVGETHACRVAEKLFNFEEKCGFHPPLRLPLEHVAFNQLHSLRL